MSRLSAPPFDVGLIWSISQPFCERVAFKQGKVKHIYFIAETKGSMSSLELREIEKSKIKCARKFSSKIASDEVKYDVIDGYDKLMELVV